MQSFYFSRMPLFKIGDYVANNLQCNSFTDKQTLLVQLLSSEYFHQLRNNSAQLVSLTKVFFPVYSIFFWVKLAICVELSVQVLAFFTMIKPVCQFKEACEMIQFIFTGLLSCYKSTFLQTPIIAYINKCMLQFIYLAIHSMVFSAFSLTGLMYSQNQVSLNHIRILKN